MSIFDFLKPTGINQGVEEFYAEKDALLLDVRSPEEFSGGHIPGSINLPLSRISEAEALYDNKDIPVYVYCYSGGRSRQAAAALRNMGYNRVKNIGGISSYSGKVEY